MPLHITYVPCAASSLATRGNDGTVLLATLAPMSLANRFCKRVLADLERVLGGVELISQEGDICLVMVVTALLARRRFIAISPYSFSQYANAPLSLARFGYAPSFACIINVCLLCVPNLFDAP